MKMLGAELWGFGVATRNSALPLPVSTVGQELMISLGPHSEKFHFRVEPPVALRLYPEVKFPYRFAIVANPLTADICTIHRPTPPPQPPVTSRSMLVVRRDGR